jgi:hypothetical protein
MSYATEAFLERVYQAERQRRQPTEAYVETIDSVLRNCYVPVMRERLGGDVSVGPPLAGAEGVEWRFVCGSHEARLRIDSWMTGDAASFARALEREMWGLVEDLADAER